MQNPYSYTYMLSNTPVGWPSTPTSSQRYQVRVLEWHMSPRVRTRQREFTAEIAWSGSGSRSGITPAVERTVHYPPTYMLSILTYHSQ
ncbi:hypothetical protein Hanom_Chr16g01510601 [Helianthus anomalus]